MGPCPCFPSVLPAPIPQLSGTGHCIVFSLQGGDSGASSSGNISVVAPATPAGGSRSSSRNLGSSGPEKEEGKKVRRQWESWSTEDKNTFFEGLYEVSCRHETKTHKQSSSWVLTVHLVFRTVVISFLGLLGLSIMFLHTSLLEYDPPQGLSFLGYAVTDLVGVPKYRRTNRYLSPSSRRYYS